MPVHPLAGKPAPASMLIDPQKLVDAYFARIPDPEIPEQRVVFGTSGHRGSSERTSFNEAHILAIVQAVCEHRDSLGIDGPMYVGRDTHAVAEVSQRTACEVLAAHGMQTFIASGNAVTPTPVISRAILAWNRGREDHLADGLILTPSHNPPEDGGIKYNPPNGGPADAQITKAIEARANELLKDPTTIKRMPYARAKASTHIRERDFITPYVKSLESVLDMKAIRDAKVHLGVDPLGGTSLGMWDPIVASYGIDLTVVNRTIDPTFGFMPVDHDGKIRMDCSSPYAMANLVALKDQYDLAFGNDTDADRHGIVTKSGGLMNPNHYLAVAVQYLFQNRAGFGERAGVGKTLVSSSMIDRVAASLGKRLVEVPVGFKYFVDGFVEGTLGFGGEESAGASFLRFDGSVWTTDKDGILLGLLAAEILATTGKDPSEHYRELTSRFGDPRYTRVDQPATAAQKASLKNLSAESVHATTLAGEEITAKLTRAPGNNAEIGGLKVVTENGWFAARPSGTEDVYKIYAESFRGDAHLSAILEEARGIVGEALTAQPG